MAAENSAKIKAQVEFYFSDSNFRRDKFLRKETQDAKDGFVEIAKLLTFNRLKELTTDCAAVADALKDSEIVTVSENGLGVKRSKPLPAQDESKVRTVFVKTLPENTKWESVRDKFTTAAGPVFAVRLRRDRARKQDGTCFVEFADEASARKAVELAAEGGAGIELEEGKKLSVTPLADWIKANHAAKKEAAKLAKQKAEEKALADKKKDIVPNLIVRVSNLPRDTEVITIKEALKENSNGLLYLELESEAAPAADAGDVKAEAGDAKAEAGDAKAEAGSEDAPAKGITGLARFKTAEDQEDFVEKCTKGEVKVGDVVASAVVVTGEEEQQYYDRMFRAFGSDNGRKGRHTKGRGGRGRDGGGRGRGRGRGRGGGGGRSPRKRDRDESSSAPAKEDGAADKVMKKEE